MKKIVFTGVMIILAVVLYLQYGRDIYVCSTKTYGSENEIREEVVLYANKLFVADKDHFAQDVIERYKNNSFNEVYFSREKGTVQAVTFFVYLNACAREHYKKAFNIMYYPEDTDGYIIYE